MELTRMVLVYMLGPPVPEMCASSMTKSQLVFLPILTRWPMGIAAVTIYSRLTLMTRLCGCMAAQTPAWWPVALSQKELRAYIFINQISLFQKY